MHSKRQSCVSMASCPGLTGTEAPRVCSLAFSGAAFDETTGTGRGSFAKTARKPSRAVCVADAVARTDPDTAGHGVRVENVRRRSLSSSIHFLALRTGRSRQAPRQQDPCCGQQDRRARCSAPSWSATHPRWGQCPTRGGPTASKRSAAPGYSIHRWMNCWLDRTHLAHVVLDRCV